MCCKQGIENISIHITTPDIPFTAILSSCTSCMNTPLGFWLLDHITIHLTKYYTIWPHIANGKTFIRIWMKKWPFAFVFVPNLVVMWKIAKKPVENIVTINYDPLYQCNSRVGFWLYTSKGVIVGDKYIRLSISRIGIIAQSSTCNMSWSLPWEGCPYICVSDGKEYWSGVVSVKDRRLKPALSLQCCFMKLM